MEKHLMAPNQRTDDALELARQQIKLHELNRDGHSGRREPVAVTLAKALLAAPPTTNDRAAELLRIAKMGLPPDSAIVADIHDYLDSFQNDSAKQPDVLRVDERRSVAMAMGERLAHPETAPPPASEAGKVPRIIEVGSGHYLRREDRNGKDEWRLCYDGEPIRWLHEFEQSMVNAALRADGGTAKVPEGWKLVPVEPTPAMVENGCNEVIAPIPTAVHKAAAVYRAMLAAAPSPSVNEESR
jgi:hypothetical protein